MQKSMKWPRCIKNKNTKRLNINYNTGDKKSWKIEDFKNSDFIYF